MSNAIEAAIEIAAPPGAVYQALTDETMITQWLSEQASVSLADNHYEFWGRYTPDALSGDPSPRQVLLGYEPDRWLKYTWPISGDETTVECTVEPIPDGTRLKVTHHGFSEEEVAWTAEAIWSLGLENLRALVERSEAGARFDFLDVPVGDVKVSIDIDAPPETVYDALINPRQLDRYMAQGAAIVEPQPGGRYDVGWEGEGPVEIIDLEPNEKLVYSWKPKESALDAGDIVTWTLEGSGTRTRLTVFHSGFAQDRNGLDYGLGWLDFMNQIKFMSEVGETWRKPEISIVEDNAVYIPSAGVETTTSTSRGEPHPAGTASRPR